MHKTRTETFSLAAVQLRFAPQNYIITEGDVANVILVAMSSSGGYEFDFTVTFQSMNRSATGESNCQRLVKFYKIVAV